MRYLPILLLLTGCATSSVYSNETGGVVSVRGVVNQQRKGMEAAEVACAKYGKSAHYVSMNDIHATLSYECAGR